MSNIIIREKLSHCRDYFAILFLYNSNARSCRLERESLDNGDLLFRFFGEGFEYKRVLTKEELEYFSLGPIELEELEIRNFFKMIDERSE